MDKTVITLNQEDLIELQAILVDKDEGASLRFLQTRIGPRIPSKGSAPCDSSRRNAYLLKPEAEDRSTDR